MKDYLLCAFLAVLFFSGCSMPTDDTSFNYESPPDPVPEYTLTFVSRGGSYVEPFYNV
jgi:hypothetical protein